jgi:mercuric ion transport protein
MTDRTAIRAGLAGAVLAAICCAVPLLAKGLPLAGVGAWLAGTGPAVLLLTLAGLGLVAWAIHRRAKAASCEATIHKEGVKP